MNPPHQPRSGELYIKTINVFFCQARVSAGYLSLNSRPFLRPAQKKKKITVKSMIYSSDAGFYGAL